MQPESGTTGWATDPDRRCDHLALGGVRSIGRAGGQREDCDITAELRASGDRQAVAATNWMGRPTLFAIAVMNVITGLVVLVLLAPLAAGADAGFYRDCAMAGATKGCGGSTRRSRLWSPGR